MAGRVSDVHVCCSAYEGHLGAVQAALEKEAGQVRARDASGRTALHWACSAGQSEIAALLLSKGAEVKI